EGALLDRGVRKERIHIERFTAETPPGAVTREIAALQTQAEGLTVSVTLDGRTRKVPFTAGNILDSARASGLPAPFACKAGVCATCRATVTKGKVEMAARYGLTDEEAERRLVEQQEGNGYLGMAGDKRCAELIRPLLLGEHADDERIAGVQTPGGCGALRLGFELIATMNPGARVLLGTPSWPNHAP